jgi:hypothetical protein
MSGALPGVHAAAALRRVCGVAALLGLFAMHGSATHGPMHGGHDAEPVRAVVAVAGHDHGPGNVAIAENGDGSPSGASEERAPDRQLLGLAGLCLAVLLAGVLAAIILGRLIRFSRRRDPDAAADGWASRARRDRDPPCLFALSIQRC